MKGSRILAGIVAVLALVGLAARADAQAYHRWYLAEGAANAFFNETILIGNPNAATARVTIRLLPEGQPPHTPITFDVRCSTGPILIPVASSPASRRRVYHRPRRNDWGTSSQPARHRTGARSG